MAVGVFCEAEHRKRPAFGLAEARQLLRFANMREPGRDRVQGIGEVAPPRWRVGTVRGELAAPPLPAGNPRLRLSDLLGAHAVEEVVPGVVLADMVEAEKAPGAGTVEIGRLERCLELAGRGAARNGAIRPRPFHPPVQFGLFRCHRTPLYRPN